jgi:Zn-dependent metalloprotease
MKERACGCLIVPPRMLRYLAERSQGPVRNTLFDSAFLSERLRGHRLARGRSLITNATGEKQRSVYDCKQRQSVPPRGLLVRSEGQTGGLDESVDQAYDNAGKTYDFYLQVLARNSIDNRGMRLDSFVHFGRDFNNAFWDGSEMVYGDGDGSLFLGFTGALDVVAHELTHGITQFSTPGGLDYEDQSGALNESISDVFGSVVKQWALKQSVEEADWLIGADIMHPSVGKALRSMKEPGNTQVTWEWDDQPGSMSGYVPFGDVHTNSGIPNRAFYLAASALGGFSWEKAARIWYQALPLLQAQATFADAARATTQVAFALFGEAERAAVDAAWKQVEVV